MYIVKKYSYKIFILSYLPLINGAFWSIHDLDFYKMLNYSKY